MTSPSLPLDTLMSDICLESLTTEQTDRFYMLTQSIDDSRDETITESTAVEIALENDLPVLVSLLYRSAEESDSPKWRHAATHITQRMHQLF